MQTATVFNTETGASRIVSCEQAEVIVRGSRGGWSFDRATACQLDV